MQGSPERITSCEGRVKRYRRRCFDAKLIRGLRFAIVFARKTSLHAGGAKIPPPEADVRQTLVVVFEALQSDVTFVDSAGSRTDSVVTAVPVVSAYVAACSARTGRLRTVPKNMSA